MIVTHNMQQAAVSDRTAFFLMGELVEFDVTDTLFRVISAPKTTSMADLDKDRFTMTILRHTSSDYEADLEEPGGAF